MKIMLCLILSILSLKSYCKEVRPSCFENEFYIIKKVEKKNQAIPQLHSFKKKAGLSCETIGNNENPEFIPVKKENDDKSYYPVFRELMGNFLIVNTDIDSYWDLEVIDLKKKKSIHQFSRDDFLIFKKPNLIITYQYFSKESPYSYKGKSEDDCLNSMNKKLETFLKSKKIKSKGLKNCHCKGAHKGGIVYPSVKDVGVQYLAVEKAFNLETLKSSFTGYGGCYYTKNIY